MATGMPALHAGVPERIELLQAHRAAAAVARHRRGPDQHGLGAAFQVPFEFFQSAVDVAQVDHRGGEDAVLVVELPGLVHPLVQGVHDVEDQVGSSFRRSSTRLASVGNISV